MSQPAPQTAAPQTINPARLKAFPIFASLKPEELATLAAQFQEERRPRGELLIRQGAEGDFFYLIEEGQVYAQREEMGEGIARFLGYFGPGSFIG